MFLYKQLRFLMENVLISNRQPVEYKIITVLAIKNIVNKISNILRVLSVIVINN